jgi:hypothetical protein
MNGFLREKGYLYKKSIALRLAKVPALAFIKTERTFFK